MKMMSLLQSKCICLGTFLLFTSNIMALPLSEKTELQSAPLAKSEFSGWKLFHSVPGNCQVSFPKVPEHLHQTMALEENSPDLRYDVYVSAQEKDAIYMVLIAQYPSSINEDYATIGLNSFLNGILKQNPQNQLIFADLIDVQGFKGLDFFIRSQGVYFKGRAIMAKSNLYFLAMECEMNKYKEHHFDYFINSFEILK